MKTDGAKPSWAATALCRHLTTGLHNELAGAWIICGPTPKFLETAPGGVGQKVAEGGISQPGCQHPAIRRFCNISASTSEFHTSRLVQLRRHHVSIRSFCWAVSECHLPGTRSLCWSPKLRITPLTSSQDKEKPMAVRSSNIVAARGAIRSATTIRVLPKC